MNGTTFYKMTGSGNDFVFVDGRTDPVAGWTAERIEEVCNRRTGVGADGLVILEPDSEPGTVRFHFFNCDGARAEMCGNGALCATRLAARLELAPAESMRLRTDAGTLETRCVPDSADRAELRLPDVVEVRALDIDLLPGEQLSGFALVGVPHAVLLVDDIAAIDLTNRGRSLRHDPVVGLAGANVNFVGQADDGPWAMRTYERVVEAETLACGTGAVACAAVLAGAGKIELPWDVRSRSGQILSVTGAPGPGGSPPGLLSPRLAGQGRLVFRGIF